MKLIPHGKTRLVLVAGGFAFKLARGRTGCLCNLFEARTWIEATPERRIILCPVLACEPRGLVLVMPEAQPINTDEAEAHHAAGTFPDWDYWPGDPDDPFEPKAANWGMLEGRLVALDYSAPAIPFPDQGSIP
ncbi:hypothetical protein [Methylobacterium sp.]|uniref:hypothetical protein n=1 Tax=Methylobacterium sp. TaxID=409 RepID=UPI0025F34402|nr:hypothetical protein [Methylobacterium sp.]MBY0256213.1 hypothetical protein [Methylobacterium sp.]